MKVDLNIDDKAKWLSPQTPFVISGPCSVESEEQVLAIAQELSKNNQINVLRGGIWKPRTRPNSFEGVGEVGLAWLKSAGKEVGLPVATEVAKAQHVEEALKANIDMLWVGARTTVNPFSVQEIADALKGVDIPVFVKNPVTPDLNLWIGALERLNATGISKLGAIHRGFTSPHKNGYRNAPMWELPIDLKIQCPNLPIICDPSHISGNRELIAKVAQKAMDLEMDGLMIESHINPDEARSDAEQQIKPEQLVAIFSELQIRKSGIDNKEFVNNLEKLRAMIDEVDDAIINQFATRMELVEKIGKYKLDNDVIILQLERWEQILKTRTDTADKAGLSADFIKKMLNIIHQESIRIQTKVMNK